MEIIYKNNLMDINNIVACFQYEEQADDYIWCEEYMNKNFGLKKHHVDYYFTCGGHDLVQFSFNGITYYFFLNEKVKHDTNTDKLKDAWYYHSYTFDENGEKKYLISDSELFRKSVKDLAYRYCTSPIKDFMGRYNNANKKAKRVRVNYRPCIVDRDELYDNIAFAWEKYVGDDEGVEISEFKEFLSTKSMAYYDCTREQLINKMLGEILPQKKKGTLSNREFIFVNDGKKYNRHRIYVGSGVFYSR